MSVDKLPRRVVLGDLDQIDQGHANTLLKLLRSLGQTGLTVYEEKEALVEPRFTGFKDFVTFADRDDNQFTKAHAVRVWGVMDNQRKWREKELEEGHSISGYAPVVFAPNPDEIGTSRRSYRREVIDSYSLIETANWLREDPNNLTLIPNFGQQSQDFLFAYVDQVLVIQYE
jgi:hypothetical protein